ncbi:MAG: AAA family ATPase [Alphaproteobacteria bacterium]|nr:MAG: AAA family ATPase [Alphaproteobacteria bacterium]
MKKPYVIVLGNEKGGTGKSTLSMHLIVSLLRKGHKVGSIDVDARQGTLTRYFHNRKRHLENNPSAKLPMPEHHELHKSANDNVTQAHKEDEENFAALMEKLSHCDYVVVDTPGNDTYLSRVAHSYASTLITPINDSFIDLDMLVRVNDNSKDAKDIKPSLYSQTVWEQKMKKAKRDGGQIDWIVVRNRLSNLSSNNNMEIEKILSALAPRIGFRLISGFTERVIFKELFLQGVTLLDLIEIGMQMRLSHIAARNELAVLIKAVFSSQDRVEKRAG